MNDTLFIQWQKQNETGISLIDEQHIGIVSIINSFHYLMGKEAGNSILYSSISDTLKNYSRIHFITEERMLEALGYPELAAHKEMHRNLTVEIDQIEYIAIQDNDARPLLNFLKNWWVHHINEEDMHYAQVLRKMGKLRD
ncbi:MAG: bacteriohemerythrin [Zoogloeaceae bacterium]|jgi:hemerythrin-like metal-binding protein|nr:bacteriohemerythrin [Zoogloeaceae bacterium]